MKVLKSLIAFTETLKAFQALSFRGTLVSADLVAAQCPLTFPEIKKNKQPFNGELYVMKQNRPM
jgi:hypothetical protein